MKRSNYEILASLSIEKILPMIVLNNRNARREVKVNGKTYYPRVGSERLMLFVSKGTKCASCGLEAKEFQLQYNKNQNAKQPHLGLWGICKKGEWRLFTIDHIVPKSKGGANRLYNYQVMCHACNWEKGCGD